MVESNLVLAEASEEEIESASTTLTQQEAKDNIAFLKTQVESWLAVFFNVYGSVGRDSRGLIGEVIVAWASIAAPQVRQYLCIQKI